VAKTVEGGHVMGSQRLDMALLIKNAAQLAEMHTSLNIHGTREEFGIPPDQEVPEALLLLHYALGCKRAEQVRAVHGPENVWDTGVENDCDPTALPPEEMEKALWRHYQQSHPEVPPLDPALLPVIREIVINAQNRACTAEDPSST